MSHTDMDARERDRQLMLESKPANPLDDPEYRKLRDARQREYELTEGLDRELGLIDPEAARGTHVQAMRILAARGRAFDYTDAEYVAACQEAGYGS